MCVLALLCLVSPGAARADRSPEVQRARDLVGLGEVRAAHRALVGVLKKNPRDVDAHYELGRILLSYEPPHYEQAIKHLTYATDESPT